jgi:aminoglycoside phosphotransferase family enzyme
MINDLKKPAAYPERFREVKHVQTHISNVFIGDEYVYKIKKPVSFGFLDFSTIKLRRYYCHREVELNNRFSKGIYIGVFPVTYDGEKHGINGKGKIVDYAVKMKRLQDEDLMKFRFKDGRITSDDIERVAGSIAGFHKNSARSKEIDKFGGLDMVRFNMAENFQQTKDFIGDTITSEQFNDLRKWTDDFYKRQHDLFSQRVKDGRIRDCHGDLHMEHVCLEDPIVIFDCIEFNDRFRYADTISDIAFLLMDLEFNGGHKLSDQLRIAYLARTGENNYENISPLINYYKLYRAYVRGKVSSYLLTDPNVTTGKKTMARDIARRYFALSHSYI